MPPSLPNNNNQAQSSTSSSRRTTLLALSIGLLIILLFVLKFDPRTATTNSSSSSSILKNDNEENNLVNYNNDDSALPLLSTTTAEEASFYLRSLNVLPAFPFSNQKARLSTFKKIQQLQDTPSIKSLFQSRQQYCTRKYGKYYPLVVKQFKRRLQRSMKRMKASRRPYPLFKFQAHNFDDVQKASSSSNLSSSSAFVRGFAGHRRVFVSLVWNDGSKDPVCVGGAVIEGALQSDNDRVDIDYFIDSSTVTDKERIDHSNFKAASFGLYEIQPFIRRSGNYKLCLALNAINPRNKWQFTQQMVDSREDKDYFDNNHQKQNQFFVNTSSSSKDYNEDGDDNEDDDDDDDYGEYWASNSVGVFASRFYHDGKLDVAGDPVHCQRQSFASRQCFKTHLWSEDRIDRESVKTVQKHLREQRTKISSSITQQQKENSNQDPSSSSSLFSRGNGAWMRVGWNSSCFIDEYGNFLNESNALRRIIHSSSSPHHHSNNNNNNFAVCHGAPRFVYPRDGLVSDPTVATSTVELNDDHSMIWIFISDTSIIEFFDRRAAWKAIDKHWILYWGGSTLKQPAVNFLEYNLGVPVFEKSMEQLHEIQDIRKRPNFNSYRQWEVAISSKNNSNTNSKRRDTDDDNNKNVYSNHENNDKNNNNHFKSTFCWGGCPSLQVNRDCGFEIGLSRVVKQKRLHDCVDEILTVGVERRRIQHQREQERKRLELAKIVPTTTISPTTALSPQQEDDGDKKDTGGKPATKVKKTASEDADDDENEEETNNNKKSLKKKAPVETTTIAPSEDETDEKKKNLLTVPLPPGWPKQTKTSDYFDEEEDDNDNDSNNSNNNKDKQKSSRRNEKQQQQRHHHHLPSVIILNHFVWRYPDFNIRKTINQMRMTLQLLEKKICENYYYDYGNDSNSSSSSTSSSSPTVKLPTLIWIGGVRNLYGNMDSSKCFSDDQRSFLRMLNWKIDKLMQDYIHEFYKNSKRSKFCSSSSLSRRQVFEDVIFVGRHELTSPLHFGDKFGHLTVHFSSTKGACQSGEERFTDAKTKLHKLYARKNCVRNTAGDLMLIQWLLNILSEKKKRE